MADRIQRYGAERFCMPATLVTGPVRSGKSRFALQLATASKRNVRYVATALRDPADAEWNARMDRHARDRPAEWEVVESATLDRESFLNVFRTAGDDLCVVVDALGTWIAARIATNLDQLENDFVRFEARLDGEAAELADAILRCPAFVVIVAEEVGWDVVPVAASARLFRDVLGRMKQRLAAAAQEVHLVVCGHALDLRRLGTLF
jgi:adenosylcobinamide kinase / adenosylcobinamide-phosphate guanylyltransferase